MIQVSDLVFLLTVFAWVLAIVFGQRRLRFNFFYVVLALYGFACICSTITSANPGQSAVKLVGKFYLILLAAVTFNLVTTLEFLKKLSISWLIGTSITLTSSFFGIILFYAGIKDTSINLVVHPIFGSLPAGNYPRIEGFFIHPAMLCNYLSVSWMIAIYSFSFGWIRHRIFGLFAIFVSIVSVFTFTPGFGGLLFGTGYFLYIKLKTTQKKILRRSILAASVLIACIFLFVASITFFAYDQTGTKIPLMSGQFSPSHRALAWKTSFETFLQNPVFGLGVGEPVAYSRFTDPSGYYQLLTDAHNTYISVLGETGFVGFLSFGAIIFFLVLKLKNWRPTDALLKILRLCLIIALLDAFFYQSFTGSFEDTRHLWILFGLTLAVCSESFLSVDSRMLKNAYPDT